MGWPVATMSSTEKKEARRRARGRTHVYQSPGIDRTLFTAHRLFICYRHLKKGTRHMNAHKLHREESERAAPNDLLGVLLETIAPVVVLVFVPAMLVLLAGSQLLR